MMLVEHFEESLKLQSLLSPMSQSKFFLKSPMIFFSLCCCCAVRFKMAPVCLARRPAHLTLAFLVFLIILRTIDSLLVYNRQELLKIQHIVAVCVKQEHWGSHKPRPSYLSDVPNFLLRAEPSLPRKRRRRRGTRGGRLVKLKAWLAFSPEVARSPHNIPSDYNDCFRRFLSRRFLAFVGAWLVPIVGQHDECPVLRTRRPHWAAAGVSPGNLRPLNRAVSAALRCPTKCALVNARSVSSKTFILQDLFKSYGLDLLFITETWINADPPCKENPYEDIELERSCLSSKCVSPASSSPIPDTPTKLSSKPGFFRQNSERRSFKVLELRKTNKDAGMSSPSRISPPSTPSSPDDTPCLSGDPYNRRRRKIPKMVMKINGIFEARRGKKRMKKVSQSTESSSGRVTDENSESESDTEEKLKAHSQRLVSVQSMLRQTGRYRTLERDLIELQERKLFEYFIVVALHKTKAGVPYLPEVTQQFPLKLERNFKFMRETEDQLKVIPQFCFPDAKDWAPVDNFPSETFSFVLTGEDGSRRFGYCRRLLPSGKGRRLPEVYCIVSRLGCFDLFSKILDEVEKRRAISPALVQPFMRGIMEAPFPAPGRTITVKNFLPGSGTEVIELCRPSDSRLEHVDFECLFSSLSLRLLLRVFASLLLERRVIFTADKLSTLSQCCHAVVALLYPFTWQHTYIPVLPPSMLDIVCTPTPFIVGLLSSSLPRLKELPIEEVLVVDLGNSRFLRQLDDEDSILPHKLQAAVEHVLEKRRELAGEKGDLPNDSSSLSAVVSEAFVRFFVEMVGHYSLFMGGAEREEESSSLSSPTSPTTPSSSSPSSFQREAFRKAVTSKSLRRFLEVFMETQMFTGFIQERELRRQGLRGLFEVRAQEYLDSLPGSEQRGVNKFLKGLGNKMKFLSKK
uniref:DENN domain-containing protein 2A isoform X4 n=1 Tax=Doryrhamphus excisus TaxID=161450 RepID=UPI0025AE4FBD|nr:DENN domain-containing protein 2A isoform X4 [Doryrhamphus excisus]